MNYPLQIISGTMCVLLLVLQSAQSSAQESPQRIVIESVELPNSASQATIVKRYGITRDDLRACENLIQGVDAIIPVRNLQSSVRYADRQTRAEIQGTTEQFVRNIAPENLEGRFLKPEDMLHRQNIAVIGEKIARDLFGLSAEQALGRNLKIGQDYYFIVGVVEGREAREYERAVWIPLTTMNARMGDTFMRRIAGSIEAEACQIHRLEFLLMKDHSPDIILRRLRLLMQANHEQKDYEIRIAE